MVLLGDLGFLLRPPAPPPSGQANDGAFSPSTPPDDGRCAVVQAMTEGLAKLMATAVDMSEHEESALAEVCVATLAKLDYGRTDIGGSDGSGDSGGF